MSRVVALVVLTAAFVPAAVLGALPLVAPTVGLVTVVAMLLLDRDPGSVPAAGPAERAEVAEASAPAETG